MSTVSLRFDEADQRGSAAAAKNYAVERSGPLGTATLPTSKGRSVRSSLSGEGDQSSAVTIGLVRSRETAARGGC